MSLRVDLDRIKNIHQDFLTLDKRKSRDVLVPSSEQRREEVSKFLDAYRQDKIYNPLLVYSTPHISEQEKLINDIRLYMLKLYPDSETLSGRCEIAYWEKAQSLLNEEISRINLSPSSLVSVTSQKYGIPNLELLDKAKKLLEEPYEIPQVKTHYIDAIQVRPIAEELFRRLGRNDWEITLKENSNARYTVRTEQGRNEFNFLPGSKFRVDEITPMLMRGFIQTLRPANAQKNPQFPLLHLGFYGDNRTVSGFYNYLEERFLGNLEQERIRRSAARYIAAHVCLSGTFYDGFVSIVDFVGTDAAIDIMMRLKRGFSNTAEPGCYLQEILYWDGFHRVKTHMDNNPDDLNLMCSGKVGLEHLDLIRDLANSNIIQVPSTNLESIFIGLRDICEQLIKEHIDDFPLDTPDTSISNKIEAVKEIKGMESVQIFISYKHRRNDQRLLDELLEVIKKPVENEGAKFWWDKDIITGELWDERIKSELEKSHIALVLVSDGYLHSDYIQKEEIERFIIKRKDDGMVIFPLIISTCDWQDHEWLVETQYIPQNNKTIRANYRGDNREKLFIEIRKQLIEHVRRQRKGINSD